MQAFTSTRFTSLQPRPQFSRQPFATLKTVPSALTSQQPLSPSVQFGGFLGRQSQLEKSLQSKLASLKPGKGLYFPTSSVVNKWLDCPPDKPLIVAFRGFNGWVFRVHPKVKPYIMLNRQRWPGSEWMPLKPGDQFRIGSKLMNISLVMPPLTEDIPNDHGCAPVSDKAHQQTLQMQNTHDLCEPMADGFRFAASAIPIFSKDSHTPVLPSVVEIIEVNRQQDPIVQELCEWARSLKGQTGQEIFEQIRTKIESLGIERKDELGLPLKRILLGEILKEGQANCRHFSLLFKLLMNEAGLHTHLQEGTVNLDGEEDLPHAWSLLGRGENTEIWDQALLGAHKVHKGCEHYVRGFEKLA